MTKAATNTVVPLRPEQSEAQRVANLIHRYDTATNDAEQSLKAAGGILWKMKQDKPANVTWPKCVAAAFEDVEVRGTAGMSWQWANKLIRMHKGEVTLEGTRAKQREWDNKRPSPTRAGSSAGVGCDAPEFPDPEEEGMSDSETALFHIRYCAATAKDRAFIARKEMAKTSSEDVTEQEINDCRNTGRLWLRLANDLTKRRTKEKADGDKKGKATNAADARHEATVD